MTDSPPALSFREVSHRYGKTPSVAGISFDLAPGEILCLLGPSGCGKTTLLRLASGLEVPDRGEILMNGRKVAQAGRGVAPDKRPIAMVFQDYALFPHLNVLQNIVFGLSRIEPTERYRRAREVLAQVGLAAEKDRFPHTLSGGQQQRVALARAVALRPAVMLMDEPFSNLDANLRFSVREETRRILQEEGTATVLVTHDSDEATQLADRILLMERGGVVQEGIPDDFLFRPVNPFTARFFGETHTLRGSVEGGVLHTVLGSWPVGEGREVRDGPVEVIFREQAFQFREPLPDGPHHPSFRARVLDSRPIGGRRMTRFRVVPTGESEADGPILRASHRLTTPVPPGETVPCWIDPQLVFPFAKG